MINLCDFGCMRQGLQLSGLSLEEAELTKAQYLVQGKKNRVLLLLHGFSSTPAVYRHFIPALPDYDAISVPLLPTHGESIEAFATMQGDELLVFVEDVAASLVKEYQQVDVLGLSLGGVLALHVANNFNIRQLFLLAPALDLHLSLNRTIKLASFLQLLGFHTLRSLAGSICHKNSYEIAYKQIPLATVKELLTLIKNFKFTLPSCPIDLFLGSQDDVVASAEVAARFEGSHTQIHWLKRSAHVLPLDNDWNLILNCIKQRFPIKS